MMAESRKDMQRMLLVLERDRQKAFRQVILFIKDLDASRSTDGITQEEWKSLISGIGSIIEGERRSYSLKPSAPKERSLQKLGNEYRWIVTHIPEDVIRAAWPNDILPRIMSALDQPEDKKVCYPLLIPLAQTLKDIISVRPHRDHLKVKVWKKLLSIFLKILLEHGGDSIVRIIACNIIAILAASNKCSYDSNYLILSCCLKFIREHRSEAHTNTLILDIINYVLLEYCPDILHERSIREELKESIPTLINIFSSARVGSRLFFHSVSLIRLLVYSDVSLENRVDGIDDLSISDQLLHLHDIILDKVDMSFPTNPENFAKFLVNSLDAGKYLLFPRDKSGSGYINPPCYLGLLDGVDIYTNILRLHTQLVLRMSSSALGREVNASDPSEKKKVRLSASVIDEIFEIALSSDKLTQSKSIWCIKVLCVLAMSMGSLPSMVKEDFTKRFSDAYEQCVQSVCTEGKKLPWQMLLAGLILHTKNAVEDSERFMEYPLSFETNLRHMCEVSLCRILRNDMCDISFFVIKNALNFIILHRMQALLLWISQELLEILNSNKFRLPISALHSYATVANVMSSEYTDFELNLIVDHLLESVANDDVGYNCANYTLSAYEPSKTSINNVLTRLCEANGCSTPVEYSHNCSSFMLSPFKMLPDETIIIQSKLTYLACIYNDLKSDNLLSALGESYFSDGYERTRLLTYKDICTHSYWNIEVTCFIASKLKGYLRLDPSDGQEHRYSPTTESRSILAKTTRILSMSVNWMSSLRLCNRLCHLKSVYLYLNELFVSAIERLVSDLDSCPPETIASDDILLNIYHTLLSLMELSSRQGVSFKRYAVGSETGARLNLSIPVSCIVALSNSLINLLHYISNKVDYEKSREEPKVDFGVESSDKDDSNVSKSSVDVINVQLYALYPHETLNGMRDRENAALWDNYLCLVINSLRIIYNIPARAYKHDNIKDVYEVREKIHATLMHMIPRTYRFSSMAAFFLLDWIRDAAQNITEAHALTIIDMCSEMLSKYQYEEDFITWIFVLRLLTSIIQTTASYKPQSKIIINVSHVIMFFSQRVFKNSMSWRVVYELEKFIIECLKTNVSHPILSCISYMQNNSEWIVGLGRFLMKYNNIFVSSEAYRICILCLCGNVLPSPACDTMRASVLHMHVENKLKFTVSAMGLGYCMLKSEEFRIEILICLLQNRGAGDSIANKVLSKVAVRLGYTSIEDLFRKEILDITWSLGSQLPEHFPFDCIGCTSLSDAYGHIIAYCALQKQGYKPKITFPSDCVCDKDLKRISLSVIPYALSRNIINIMGDAIRAQRAGCSLEEKDTLTNIRESLFLDQPCYDKYKYIIPLTITNILFFHCPIYSMNSDAVSDILRFAGEYVLSKLDTVGREVTRCNAIFNESSNLLRRVPTEEYLKSVYSDQNVFCTFQDTALAILSLPGVLDYLNGYHCSMEELFRNVDIVLRDEIVHKVLRLIGTRLKNTIFITKKRIFLRYGYVLFLSLFEDSLYNTFFLGLILSHIFPLLGSTDFCDDASILMGEICSKFSRNSPQSLEDHFIHIITQLTQTISDAAYFGRKKIVKSTMKLMELLFDISCNIDEKIVKLAKSHASTETRGLNYVRLDTFGDIMLPTRDYVYSDLRLAAMFARYMEKHTLSPMHAYSSYMDQCGSLGSHENKVFGYPSLPPHEYYETDTDLLTLAESLNSSNFYTQVISIVTNYIMHPEEETSEVLVSIVKSLLDSEEGRVEIGELPKRVIRMVDIIKRCNPDMSIVSSEKVYPSFSNPSMWDPLLKPHFKGVCSWGNNHPDNKFEDWVVNLVNSLITTLPMDDFYKALPRIFEIKPLLALKFITHVIYKCLVSHSSTKIPSNANDSSANLQDKNTVYVILSCNFNKIVENFENIDGRFVEIVIRVVEFLILKSPPKFDTPFDCYKWLNISYFNLARAAYSKSLYVSALRFIELSLEDNLLALETEATSIETSGTISNDISALGASTEGCFGDKMNLLVKIWDSLGERHLGITKLSTNSPTSGSEITLYSGEMHTNISKGSTFINRTSPYDITLPLSCDHYTSTWQNVLSECESRLQLSTLIDSKSQLVEPQLNIDLMEALCKLKNYHTLDIYTDGFILRQVACKDILQMRKKLENDAKFLDIKFEGLWRSGNYIHDEKTIIHDPKFNQLLHKSLCAIRKGDIGMFRYFNGLNFCRELHEFISLGTRFSLECTKTLFILTEFSELADIMEKHPHTVDRDDDLMVADYHSISTLLNMWQYRLDSIGARHGFSEIELIIEARIALLKSIMCSVGTLESKTEDNTPSLKSLLAEAIHYLCLRYIKLARREGNHVVALHQLFKLKNLLQTETSSAGVCFLSNVDEKILNVSFENMKIMWDKKVMVPSKHKFQEIRNQALSLLNNNAKRLTGTCELVSTVSKLVSCLGKWAGESQSETPECISYEYFDTALSTINQENVSNKHELLHYVYEKYAGFAHEQYNILCSGDATCDIKNYIDYKLCELRVCEKLEPSKKSLSDKMENAYQRLTKKLKIQIDMGNQEIENYNKKLSMFLRLAIKNYLLSLQVGDNDSDMSAFRLCILWFSRFHEKDICKMIDTHCTKIPSYKFVPLLYQLAARSLALAKDAYPLKVLQKIIYRTARDHPHHTLYNLITLGNMEFGESNSKGRCLMQIMNTLRTQKSSKCNKIIMGMELLSKKLIDLMEVTIPSDILKKVTSFDVDNFSDFRTFDYGQIAVPVHRIPISKNAHYDDIPTLKHFKPKFFVPGGINKPKVIHCVDSDGLEYSLLIKGKDDLKQDSVLMSIFEIVNELFYKDASSHNKLKIRLYKVIPLAQRAGIVEWIKNTIPIGVYLTHAHPLYNVGDYTPSFAHSKIYGEYKKKESSHQTKLKVFNDVTKNFKPVFRHFFFENYRSASEWYLCRSAYMRSLATTSIAGYVVGLGDRHAHNILIDKSTGELIHVDFGVAFEQGKLLSTPETVPFRLTRDMVDGLGRTGCEGTFRRSCEDTLTILKKSSEIFLLILNVFKYDPLYTWKLSPLQQYKRQGFGDDVSGDGNIVPNFGQSIKEKNPENKEAERAVFNVSAKLSSPLSVKCRVNELIEAARDPKNLCTMYPGWYV